MHRERELHIQLLASGETPPYELLLLADPSRELVDRYLKQGICYMAVLPGEAVPEKPVGVFVLLRGEAGTVEIMNIAVREEAQGKGIGRKLLQAAIEIAKASDARAIEIGTGNSSLQQLALYQKCGFRIIGVDRDFFVRNYAEAIYENGIQCRDMIRLRYEEDGETTHKAVK
ncbi:ribosomal protein S18 acetylase RimI-like enzyme [Paenibacillus forsythiae]|uniref:Ribosomal protein S18 acetylase RimI-like enzyme n=1 Tax=Paenibacillus forsythiae TaxID=365616 RepID=A0ABU3H987_9BACL|nr:GNAT family N-acetyltransferase [Paenibacillus forsythiae]MDT3427387.1 ribosomal protein S18 acetylase RimI-like enzyme [Paenibacillus forsythiae]